MAYKTYAQWKADLDANINTNGIQGILGATLNTNQTNQADSIYWGEKDVATGVAVSSSGTTIPLLNAIEHAGNYALIVRCYDASGNNIDFTITDKGLTSFKVTPATDGFIDYIVNT